MMRIKLLNNPAQVQSSLWNYSRRGIEWNPKAILLLEQNPDIDVCYKTGSYFHFALRDYNTELLQALLEYAEQPQHVSKSKLRDVLQEAYDSFPISPEIEVLLRPYLDYESSGDSSDTVEDFEKEVAASGAEVETNNGMAEDVLLAAARSGDVKTITSLMSKHLYLRSQVLFEATSHKCSSVIETLVSMTLGSKAKAMLLCDAGDLYSKAGSFEESDLMYNKAIKQEPSYYVPYLHLAGSLVLRGDVVGSEAGVGVNTELYQLAAGYYKEILEHKPDHAYSHKKLGILYQRMGEDVKAIEYYINADLYKQEYIKYPTLYKTLKHLLVKHANNELVFEIAKINLSLVRNESLKVLLESIVGHHGIAVERVLEQDVWMRMGMAEEVEDITSDTLSILSTEDLEYVDLVDAQLMGNEFLSLSDSLLS